MVMSALIHRGEGPNVTYTDWKHSNGLIIIVCDETCTICCYKRAGCFSDAQFLRAVTRCDESAMEATQCRRRRIEEPGWEGRSLILLDNMSDLRGLRILIKIFGLASKSDRVGVGRE